MSDLDDARDAERHVRYVLKWRARRPRLPLVSHRGVTRTVVFALFTGAVLAILGVSAGASTGPLAAVGLGVLGFYLGDGTIASHVAAAVSAWTVGSAVVG